MRMSFLSIKRRTQKYFTSADGSANGKNTEDYDPEKETSGMKVKSARFIALGEATDIEQEE